MKKHLVIMLFFLMLLVFMGCIGNDKRIEAEQKVLKENEYRVYCLNKEGTRITYNVRAAEAKEQQELIFELLGFLSENTDEINCQCAIESPVRAQTIKVVSGLLYVYFTKEYYMIDPIKEVLVRAAIVKTLTQVEGIERVRFYVDGKEQENEKGIVVGSMTAADFVDDIEEDITDADKIKVTLYFTDEQGTKLYMEEREVLLDKKSSRAKIVLDELMKGPSVAGRSKVLPEGLTIISVVTKDGVCYLDMDETFLTGSINVVETIPVYAIVNSLTELYDIDAVQILINGEMGKVYREVIRFDSPFEERKDLIANRK